MKSEWKISTIEQVCNLVTDGAHYSPPSVERGEYMVSVKDFTAYGFDFTACRKISKEDYDKLYEAGCVPQKKDILVGKDGARFFEDIILYKQEEKPALLSSIAILRVDEKQIIPAYLYYYLKSPNIKKDVRDNYGSGSAIPRIVLKDFKRMPVSYPPLPTQRKIASILSALDDKIETNNDICRNLEEQAMAVFKRCFFTHSEQLVEDKPVYDFAEYINGAAFKQHEYGESGLPIIKIAELKSGLSSSTLFYRGEDKDEKYYIQNGDILFSWSGNPETSIDVFIWTRGDAILNQHIFNVKSRCEAKWFTYLMLKNYMPVFAKIASDKQTTGLGHVTVADLKRLTFPYNTNQILDFEKEVSIYMEQVYNTLVMNNHLTNLRDTLLPKLMNGELEVETLV